MYLLINYLNLEAGYTYLHLAAEHGQTEMFENIFNEEIDKEPRDRFGRTPFQIACEKGHARIAEFIIKSSIENNIDLNWNWSYDGTTGFMLHA